MQCGCSAPFLWKMSRQIWRSLQYPSPFGLWFFWIFHLRAAFILQNHDEDRTQSSHTWYTLLPLLLISYVILENLLQLMNHNDTLLLLANAYVLIDFLTPPIFCFCSESHSRYHIKFSHPVSLGTFGCNSYFFKFSKFWWLQLFGEGLGNYIVNSTVVINFGHQLAWI